MRRALRGILAAFGVILAMTALLLAAQEMSTESAYHDLGERGGDLVDKGEVAKRNWDQILDENGEAVGWITVEETPIDYPVVQPTHPTQNDFYLSHNFWRQADVAGCPYLDTRTNIAGTHMMIFGHRLGSTNRMFGSLSSAWKQKAFESLGVAHLETPDGDAVFSPFCALKVDCGFSDIQRFDFDTDEDMESWLSKLLLRSSAHHAEAESLVTRANRALTLVTCTGPRIGGRERTLTVFVSCT